MTVLAFVIGVVILVVGLAVSIALHELGHLLPAKAFGVRVGQYMIGFGPTIWSRRRGETQYGVKALPLGGYISMAGMYPPSPEATAEPAATVGEHGDADASEAGDTSVRVERAASAGEESRRTRFFQTLVQDARAVNDETMTGQEDDRVFYRLPVFKRVIIMLGGPLMNLLLAIVLFTILFSGIGVQTATTTVASISDCVPVSTVSDTCAGGETPAAQAGLRAGDQIVSIDGTAVSTFAEAYAIIQKSAGTRLSVVVLRDGAEQTLSVTPVAVQTPVTDAAGAAVTGADGQPEMREVGFIGFRPSSAYVPQPIWAGPQIAFENVGQVAAVMVKLPVYVYETAASLVTGAERDPNGPLSPVGAGALAGEIASSDQLPVLNRVAGIIGLLGSLNIALFVFNLIPLLPLDGGHIVVALWDGLRRSWAKVFRRPPPKPVDATKLVPVTFVVVTLLAVMGVVLVLADLFNPIAFFR